MSDYFGALIRASGLAPAQAPLATTLAREGGAPEPGPQEEAAPAGAVMPPQSEVAPIGHVEAQPPARPVTPVRTGDRVLTVKPAAGRPSGTQAAAPDPVPAPRPAPPTVPAPQPSRKHGDDLLQAALRWVAADPAQVDAARALPEPLPAAPPPAATAPARIVAAASRTTARLVEAPPPRRTEPTAPAAEAPLEVTIGAIHLRVDPPAPQTVAQAAPSAAPAAPSTPHSALSRRSLRRI
jgi:hypothetical protein